MPDSPLFSAHSIFGGIGDAILCIDAALEAKIVNLYTHQMTTAKLLQDFGIEIAEIKHYTGLAEMNRLSHVGKPVRQSKYLAAPIPTGKSFHPSNTLQGSMCFSGSQGISEDLKATIYRRPLIGIHPFGSHFSNEFWASRNEPIKSIEPKYVKHLIDELSLRYNVVIFGHQHELDFLNKQISDVHAPWYAYTDIIDTFQVVSQCEAIIGTDSCIKTMASVLKIPSYVFCGDYYDHYREVGPFLQPYVDDGIMKVTKFKKQTKDMFEEALNDLYV
jgi:hypothetical protein